MKRFELKTYTLGRGDNAQELPATELMGVCLEHVPQQSGGLKLSEMRKRSRVLDQIEALPKGAAYLELEDADAATLQKCVEEMQWAKVSGGIIEFGDDVKNAKSPPAKGKKAAK